MEEVYAKFKGEHIRALVSRFLIIPYPDIDVHTKEALRHKLGISQLNAMCRALLGFDSDPQKEEKDEDPEEFRTVDDAKAEQAFWSSRSIYQEHSLLFSRYDKRTLA